MKKTMLALAVITSAVAMASDFKIIISSNEVDYEVGIVYSPTGEITCSTKSPLESTIYKDTEFNQAQSDCTEIYRSSDGVEIIKDAPDQTVALKGELVLNSCLEILNNGHSRGNDDYTISYNSSETEVNCDMTTDGGGWTRWWWYENRTTFPNENDVLAYNFGDASVNSDYGFQTLPSNINKSETELLVKDGVGNKFVWDFASSSNTSQNVWDSFKTRKEVLYGASINSGTWNPRVISGSFAGQTQDSFMYREENGVKSFLLDDDGCDCYSTINAGSSMCFDSWDPTYGGALAFGVDNLSDNTCQSTQPTKSMLMYYR